MDSSTTTIWIVSISSRRGVWLVLLLKCFTEIPVFDANSVDPDQMQHYAASNLGLNCLPVSLLWDARQKWVKGNHSKL